MTPPNATRASAPRSGRRAAGGASRATAREASAFALLREIDAADWDTTLETFEPPQRASSRDLRPLMDAYLALELPGDPDGLELAVEAARVCDLPRLWAIAHETGDPTPWRCLLRRLVFVHAHQRTPEIDAAARHVYALALAMLREQHLGLLRPEDLLLAPSRFERTVEAIVAPDVE